MPLQVPDASSSSSDSIIESEADTVASSRSNHQINPMHRQRSVSFSTQNLVREFDQNESIEHISFPIKDFTHIDLYIFTKEKYFNL